jgi:ribosome biogenesis protein Nip4
LAHLVNKLFFGVSLTDPQSGFRALSRSAVQKIRINNDGMAHNSEIMAKVFHHNFKIEEVGITVVYHHFGQSLGQGVKIVKDLFLSKLID